MADPDGAGFRGLELQLSAIGEQLGLVTEQHRTYPMLHYYHSESVRHATPAAVVAFDEALTLLCHGVAADRRPAPGVLHACRSTVGDYLDTLEDSYIPSKGESPPPPALERVRAAGIPVVTEPEYARAVGELTERRRLLRGLLDADGRAWPPSDGGADA